MNTMKKRVLSSVLAIAAAAAMAVPTFAADPEPNTTVVSGKYTKTEIAVTVPTTGTAFINPYGLGTTVTDSEGTKYDILGKIVTAPMAITNESNLKLNVTATITTTTTGLALKETGDIADSDKTKLAYITLQAAPAKYAGEADGLKNAVIQETVSKETVWGTSTALKTTTSVKVDNLVTLEKANQADGAFASYAAGSVALIRLSGNCVEEPQTAGADPVADPWTDTDTFIATIAFTFKPDTTPAP